MPIYEFRCRECGKEFEELCLTQRKDCCCPECGTENVEPLLSVSITRTGEVSAVSCGGTSGFS